MIRQPLLLYHPVKLTGEMPHGHRVINTIEIRSSLSVPYYLPYRSQAA